jgi:hypothetical protein
MAANLRSSFFHWHVLILLLITVVVGGCSRVSQEAQQHQLQIELIEPLYPPGVGKYTLNVRVFDSNDTPIDDAAITVKGDMTHAGMVPVLGEASQGDKGLYTIPFEWTMGGDWVLIVQATLPDGTIAEETFTLTISDDPTDCDPEAITNP